MKDHSIHKTRPLAARLLILAFILVPQPSFVAAQDSKVQAYFDAHCMKCHGPDAAKGDFRIDTRETLLKGGSSGPALVSGKSAESY